MSKTKLNKIENRKCKNINKNQPKTLMKKKKKDTT